MRAGAGAREFAAVVAALVACGWACLAIAGCSRGSPSSAASSSAASSSAASSSSGPSSSPSSPPVQVAGAKRVVSLGPSTTETLFAIGAGDRAVGRSRWCDWPPEATKLPAVGGIEPDVEAIVALRPDLVVGPSGGWSARLSETLAARGIQTWFPGEIRTLAGVDAMVLALGDKTGDNDGALRVVAGLRAREAAIDRAVQGLPRPRVLLVVQFSPVIAAGPDSFAGDLVAHAGAVDAVTGGGAWPAIGFERVVEMDPDVVVDATMGPDDGPTRITRDATGWKLVRAVREGRVVPLTDPRALRPGPRVAEGLAVLARALHPDAHIDGSP
jgi:iron complex transport system substrate-binding protein